MDSVLYYGGKPTERIELRVNGILFMDIVQPKTKPPFAPLFIGKKYCSISIGSTNHSPMYQVGHYVEVGPDHYRADLYDPENLD